MPGLLRGIARTAVVAGTATAVSNRVSRRQAGRWAQQSPPPEQPSQVAYPESIVDDDTDLRLAQLGKLNELRSQGALTEEEFQQQKRRILGQ